MALLHIIVLALIQGITEFLPISSSGHLLLPSGLLGWPEQGLVFDVAVHLGTLIAVVVYFRRDLQAIAKAGLMSLVPNRWINQPRGHAPTGSGQAPGRQSDNARLAWMLVLATIPAGVAGLVFGGVIETHLRTTFVIALTTLLFGLLLGWADRDGANQEKPLAQMTLSVALVIGCAQALALIPGTSRSGITITAALLCGFSREAAARFSFLLAVPVILLSGGYKGLGLLALPAVNWLDLCLGVLFSALSAFVCIHYFLKWINRIGMMPFVIYRIILGAFLLYWSLV